MIIEIDIENPFTIEGQPDGGSTIMIDPYMELESRYHLTRKCLEVLQEGTVEVMITTKSDNGLIIKDLELLKSFGSRLTVLMGMANINQVGKGVNSRNIEIANFLHDNGIKVWAFITPILPYIMDVDSIINGLNPEMPIFLDKLRSFGEDRLNKEMDDFISSRYP